MADSETVDALEEIYPTPITVEIASGAVEMRALGIKHLGDITRGLHVVAQILNGGEHALTYVQEHADDLLPFVAAASGLDKDALIALPGADFIKLFGGAFRANRDYFFQCADLHYGGLGIDLVRTFPGRGPAPSTTSKTAAIPSASLTP
jgi:hypothetical protein